MAAQGFGGLVENSFNQKKEVPDRAILSVESIRFYFSVYWLFLITVVITRYLGLFPEGCYTGNEHPSGTWTLSFPSLCLDPVTYAAANYIGNLIYFSPLILIFIFSQPWASLKALVILSLSIGATIMSVIWFGKGCKYYYKLWAKPQNSIKTHEDK